MESHPSSQMPILRLAYITQFLVALIAIFVFWAQVGGQGHLDLLPWYVKLALGTGVAYSRDDPPPKYPTEEEFVKQMRRFSGSRYE